MVKDKNKPKGAMSAYSCFVQVIREEHRRKHPNEQIVFSEFSKKCGEKWKTMSAKEKKRFEDMSAVDRGRYDKEMSQYVPEAGSVGKKAVKRKQTKDPNMPKRGLSAFFFFCDEFRPSIRKEHPEWKVGDVAKELGRLWEQCHDRSKYETQANNDRQRYEKDMISYKAGTFVKKAKGDGPGTSQERIEDNDDDEDLDEDDGDD